MVDKLFYGKSELKIDGINNFEWYPTRYDQTHNIKITSNI